ncbi:MAG: glycerol-3-phosphate dehydrogenase/oxidase, partial [bacterium]
FGLVFEALRERQTLSKIASHLVHRLPFLFPIYDKGGMPGWKLRLGLTVYDMLSLFRGMGWHSFLSPKKIKKSVFPGIREHGLKKGGLYYDCQMNDARIVIENILDAERRGALVRNYCEVTAVDECSTVNEWEVTIQDRRTGEQLDCRTRKIVNATGPWSDRVAGEWRKETTNYLRPTKGVHLVLPSIRTQSAGFFPSVHDDRLFFVIPWRGKTLVGTTDTDYKGNPDDLGVSTEDRDYLLKNVNKYLEYKTFSESDILYDFAGLRPLYSPGNGAPDESSVSRDHEILEERDSIYSIVGGKYTTYRAIAEETLEVMGAPGDCYTDKRMLPGAWESKRRRKVMRNSLELSGDFNPEQIHELMNTYGGQIIQVLRETKQFEDALDPVVNSEETLKAQVYYAVLKEHAHDVDDVIRRRSKLFMRGSDSPELTKQVRHSMQRAREYSDRSGL